MTLSGIYNPDQAQANFYATNRPIYPWSALRDAKITVEFAYNDAFRRSRQTIASFLCSLNKV